MQDQLALADAWPVAGPVAKPPTTFERAFQLASRCRRGVPALRWQPLREAFLDHERALFGLSVRSDLEALMTKAPRA